MTCVNLQKTSAGFSITQSYLEVTAKVPGADKARLLEIANGAKAGCLVSRQLNITMDTKLEREVSRHGNADVYFSPPNIPNRRPCFESDTNCPSRR